MYRISQSWSAMEMFYMRVRSLVSSWHEFWGLILYNAGDIQITQTNKLVEKNWMKSLHPKDSHHNPIPQKHYQLVTKNADTRLSNVKGTKELLNATFDVFNGKCLFITLIHHWVHLILSGPFCTQILTGLLCSKQDLLPMTRWVTQPNYRIYGCLSR